MCDTCGCSDSNKIIIRKLNPEGDNEYQDSHHDPHDHTHDHEHGHDHNHVHSHRKLMIETDILGKNNLLAERNRGYFEAKGIFTLNMMSSPGSGKTLLLEKTIMRTGLDTTIAVIEGDQQTLNDARRIQNTGAEVIQVNTGNGCHLDADMINKALHELNPDNNSILVIENVGNLVCPSLFDLGEAKRVVIISTTEGEDKPIKYPTMFEKADLLIINKTDLLPYLDFDMESLKDYALQVNHHLEFIELSAKTEEGIDEWIRWINKHK
ncbi:MAG: hydrogenase nickel incorporation protein HypB [Bacteroidetes bacterium]|jgi:hydrogenase nickel incorporation protein HypB|nr:hydrogenase nickel incorporation protein HypB [Bacteroidota bacterium]MBT3751607.1 hydrogenase nickel incorporation protein HypB [Bacteroidota bacterium]MBT4399960.1 hydrogenase nickel incorporation protein HypB [Bacteroidota bacterium]MBT4409066.1 hydrogenase nickel incorporation protein HypB [Bacteroidota bacterium]MBT7095008.1 hydrogenase nickel incorporation protein HypB [Bacteroidota bacterium]